MSLLRNTTPMLRIISRQTQCHFPAFHFPGLSAENSRVWSPGHHPPLPVRIRPTIACSERQRDGCRNQFESLDL